MHSVKAHLIPIAVAGLLALAVGQASANELSASNQSIRVTWSSLELGNTINGNRTRCPVTLEGSFHSRTIAKVRSSLIGYITRATVNNGSCTGGSATINTETLPWHITYEGFAGTLPTIEGVRMLLVRATFEILQEGIRCRAITSTEDNAAGIAELSSHIVTGLRADESRRIPLRQPGGGGGLCSLARGFFAGTGSVTLLGTATAIRITLLGGEPTSELSPTPVEFGRVEPSELARRTVTITAAAAATVNSIRVAAGNYFAITDPNRCVGSRLAERGTCTFSVLFAAPGEAGRSVEDTVSVETSVETLRVPARGST